jgi:hypothetical protein
MLVCPGHHAATLRALLQLGPLHRLLGEVAAVATAPARNGSRSTTTPIPLHEAAADNRQRIARTIRAWPPYVAAERNLTAPCCSTVLGPQAAVDTAVAWLIPHHDWLLAEQPERWAEDLTGLARRAWNIAYPTGRHPATFAPCPQPGCEGRLGALVSPGDDLLPEQLTCTVCGHAVPPSAWLRLGSAGTMLTAVELSALWETPIKTVERWARTAAWPHDSGRPARYDSRAAQATRDRMRGDVDAGQTVSQANRRVEAP